MPRKVKPHELQRQRRDNYVLNFECRVKWEALSAGEKSLYHQLARNIRMPGLTIWGGLDYTDDEMFAICSLAAANDIRDPWLLMPVYTDSGWQEFQRMWKELPEPVAFIHRVGTTFSRAEI